MKRLIMVMLLATLAGCGDGSSASDVCEDVDTTKAPDQIIVIGDYETWVWGDCTITYPRR